VAKVDRTYQVAPAGAPASGLEEYLVEDADGHRVGNVQTVLQRDRERLVAVERGSPPFPTTSGSCRGTRWARSTRTT
jgi:hypothetical protein